EGVSVSVSLTASEVVVVWTLQNPPSFLGSLSPSQTGRAFVSSEEVVSVSVEEGSSVVEGYSVVVEMTSVVVVEDASSVSDVVEVEVVSLEVSDVGTAPEGMRVSVSVEGGSSVEVVEVTSVSVVDSDVE